MSSVAEIEQSSADFMRYFETIKLNQQPSLTKAVKFRYLAAQLTQTERHQFINQLTDRDTFINIIIANMFHRMLTLPANQQSVVDSINNKISNIIKSRKKKPKPLPTQNIKLQQLPKRLIGEISSFLDQIDNISFSKTNRFIYLGCNSPNLLRRLDLTVTDEYVCTPLNIGFYPFVKDLKLDLNTFSELMTAAAVRGLSAMNELQSIQLNAARKSDINIDMFLQSNFRNVRNITTVRCSDFGDINSDFPADTFMKLLAKFPNVQYLELHDVFVDLNGNINEIKDIYPNLKGLRVTGGLYQQVKLSLINTFGNNLIFLSFDQYNTNFDFNFAAVNFSKLEELALFRPTIKSIDHILLTAKNLKKVCIESTMNDMTPKETKKIISQLITTGKSLEYVKVDCTADNNGELVGNVLSGIGNGLFETKKWKRNQMKIQINVRCNDRFKANDFISNIGKIVGLLDDSKINDFMFIFSLANLNKEIDKNILLEKLQVQCLSTNAKVSEYLTHFVVTSIDCKINGFCESFKM